MAARRVLSGASSAAGTYQTTRRNLGDGKAVETFSASSSDPAAFKALVLATSKR